MVNQHPHGDAGHVEPVQEVLDSHVCLFVYSVGLLQLQHPLCHGLNHVSMARLYHLQSLTEIGQYNLVSVAASFVLH